jgi:hypothetical protein
MRKFNIYCGGMEEVEELGAVGKGLRVKYLSGPNKGKTKIVQLDRVISLSQSQCDDQIDTRFHQAVA